MKVLAWILFFPAVVIVLALVLEVIERYEQGKRRGRKWPYIFKPSRKNRPPLPRPPQK